MRGTLTKLQPLHPEKIAPPEAVMAGTTPDGKQLYREVTRRSRAVPMLDEKGDRVFAKNPMTAEPLYPKNRPEIYNHERLYYLESEGNGNLRKVDYAPPTPEQLAEQARQRRIDEMGGGQLGAALVDAGITPEEAVQRILSGSAAAPAPDEPLPVPWVPDPDAEYPVHIAGGKWQLSNGEFVRSNREEAEKAEAQVQIARAADQTSF